METCFMNFCCSAVELGSFGGGEIFQKKEDSLEQLTKELKSALRSIKGGGNSVVYATTMSNQPNAAKALADAGFYTSEPFSKVRNYNQDKRKMQAWFLPLVEFKG